jgi:small subunit ribosomal protein S11
MGKKRIAQKSQEELIKEAEKIGKIKEIKIKSSQKIKEGRIYIFSSYNNTIITLTDNFGNVLYWTSAGRVGFSGTKKGTPYAASKAAEIAAEAAKQIGFEKVEVLIKGVGAGRESALRTLGAKGLNIISIKDITPIPHDGPRPPKVRRV